MCICDNSRSIEKRIKIFNDKIKTYMNEIITKIVKRHWDDNDVCFAIGMEYREKFYYFYNSGDGTIPLDHDHVYDHVEGKKAIFSRVLCLEDGCFVQFCRCIGTCENESREQNKIYYFGAVKNCRDVSSLIFQSIDKIFFDWICRELTVVMEAETLNDGFRIHFELDKMYKCICDGFQDQMVNIFAINLSVISELSGSHYEKQSCHSKLVYCFEDMSRCLPSGQEGIEFINGIEVNSFNVRAIRKYLQMAREDQYILVQKDVESEKWVIKGLYSNTRMPAVSIVFNIESHMKWNMEICGELAICYDCGKYLLDSIYFKREHLHKKYEETFGCDTPEEIDRLFENAIKQQHGTSVVILENSDKANEEMKRLLKDSIGIEISPVCLNPDYIESVTSIDGALLVGQTGLCKGIGVILDSSEKLEGNKYVDKGARHTSARKYIMKCLKENMKALIVVVSEDGPVDIFSTQEEGMSENE